MIYEESDFNFYCNDIEELVKDPINDPINVEIYSKDFYIPVSEDPIEFAHKGLTILLRLFHSKTNRSATIEEENGEHTIFADDKGHPCYRVYFCIQMTHDLPMTLDGKLFQLASGQYLSCQVPFFFEHLPELVQDQVLEQYACGEYEGEDGGTLHRRINDAMWEYKTILDGTHALWKLDGEVTETALDAICDENLNQPLDM